MGKQSRSFTTEFKREAATVVLDQGYPEHRRDRCHRGNSRTLPNGWSHCRNCCACSRQNCSGCSIDAIHRHVFGLIDQRGFGRMFWHRKN
jgi:hypothetical protein